MCKAPILAFCEKIGCKPEEAETLQRVYTLLSKTPEFSNLPVLLQKGIETADTAEISRLAERMCGQIGTTSDCIETAILCRMGIEAQTRYHEYNISSEIYWDSMADIATWIRRCRLETGKIGTLGRIGWLIHPMIPRILRIGRLQFEMVVWADGDFRKAQPAFPNRIPAGIPVLHVHIPEGEPLNPQACQLAYHRAAAFYQETFGFNPKYYACHSWLLSPQLQNLLPDESRIRKFAKDFTLLAADADSDAEWRVFGTLKPYPQQTRLQKALAPYLEQGGKIGAGFGVFPCTAVYENHNVGR